MTGAMLSAADFGHRLNLSRQAASKAFAAALEGRGWRGMRLPVIPVDGCRGGNGGRVLRLDISAAPPALRQLLGLQTTLPAPVSKPLEAPSKAPVSTGATGIAADRLRLIRPILGHPKGSAARAAAFAAAVGFHDIGGRLRRVSESTLRAWVRAEEARGVAALIPHRPAKGQRRVLVTRAWDAGCGLAEADKARIAATIERTAKGIIATKGMPDAKVIRMCVAELVRLTAEAGAPLRKADLKAVCTLNTRWVERFRHMRAVHDHDHDHKTWSDKHEFRVQRQLADSPMSVLMGDVHYLDVVVAPLAEPVRVRIIGWLDGATHYLWATPVLLGKGQGITQKDVARSLFDVTQCPFGGMPQTLLLDNGSEFKALDEGVARLSDLAALHPGFGIVKSLPYSPEGKGRIERAFANLEGCIKALPGYIGGDRMRQPTKSKGKPVDPYSHGEKRLVEDLARAVDTYNSTQQHGELGGLSPKAMMQAKIAATGWTANVPDEDVFDLVFSREERRVVRKGAVRMARRQLSAEVLAGMIGEEEVPLLVPLRDPDGPALLFRDGVIHRLTEQTFGLLDREGAKAKNRVKRLQVADMARRRAEADLSVDVPALLKQATDPTEIVANPPNTWTMAVNDKAGRLTAPVSAEEAEAADEAELRSFHNDYLAQTGGARRGASGSNR